MLANNPNGGKDWWERSHQGSHIQVCHLSITERSASVPADDGSARWKSYPWCSAGVGVGYFRPFGVKFRRSVVKRYAVISSCLAIGAIHFEVAPSPDSDSVIYTVHRDALQQDRRSDAGTVP